MRLIDRTGASIEDFWHYPSPEAELVAAPHSIVQLADWEPHIQRFGTPAAGVWVTAEQDIDALLPLLDQLELIVIAFAQSRDGRGFTLARLLRERHHYQGDLRATGPLLPDQFAMLMQCGYSSLRVSQNVPVQRWQEAADAFARSRTRPRTLLDRLTQSGRI